MPQWTAFAGITAVVLVLLLVLSHLTQSSFSGDETDTDRSEPAEPDLGERSNHTGATGSSSASPSIESAGNNAGENEHVDPDSTPATDEPSPVSTEPTSNSAQTPAASVSADTVDDADEIDPSELSTGLMLANVALSQGLFALMLLGAVLYTGIPAHALGVEFSLSYLQTGLLLGTVAGVALYVANELGAAIGTHVGFDHDEQLRELLAPDSGRRWVVLLVGVLPIVAVFEELLFRAALIGVLSTGFGISPWLLAVVSSVAFAVGHGMQGSVGIIVTGLLGFVLAAIFILTGSFLVVVVAHYLINALEFVVHEGFDLEWTETIES
ncbi:CPBP family intramembrane glutamic endopeptidase [Natrialbaceae archaeon A-arb3/5]